MQPDRLRGHQVFRPLCCTPSPASKGTIDLGIDGYGLVLILRAPCGYFLPFFSLRLGLEHWDGFTGGGRRFHIGCALAASSAGSAQRWLPVSQ
jgi:hypothetical protein